MAMSDNNKRWQWNICINVIIYVCIFMSKLLLLLILSHIVVLVFVFVIIRLFIDLATRKPEPTTDHQKTSRPNDPTTKQPDNWPDPPPINLTTKGPYNWSTKVPDYPEDWATNDQPPNELTIERQTRWKVNRVLKQRYSRCWKILV